MLPLLVGGATALAGGVAQGLGSYYGAKMQADAYKRAADQANKRWEHAYANSQPYIEGGTNALNRYNTAMGLNGEEARQEWVSGLSSDPAFAAATKYGLDEIQARNAARGMGMSGNEAAALSDYAQKNLLGYQQSSLDNLFREANLGAGVANTGMTSSTGASQAIGNLTGQAGSAAGQQYAALGNTALGVTNNLANAYKNYYYG